MPKPTFFNLEASKRKRITDAFLREFAIRSFDEASLTVVVKQLGIAKGSVYQYFEDKLDLFLYLVGVCSEVKQQYTASVKREDFPDYWAYFRELFNRGFQFDGENPLQSHFLHNLTQNLNSPSIRDLYDELMVKTLAAFKQMVEHEVQLGLFRRDLPVDTIAFLLYKIGVSIQEQLEVSGVINPKASIRDNQPVYEGKKEILLRTVDEYISLARAGFDRHEN